MPVTVETTADFDQDVKQLKKRFRRILDDLRDLVAEVMDSGYRGDRLSGTGSEVYKGEKQLCAAGQERWLSRSLHSPRRRHFAVYPHLFEV